MPWRCLTTWVKRKVPPAKIRTNGQTRIGEYCGLRGRGGCLPERRRVAEENGRVRRRRKGAEGLVAGRGEKPVENMMGADWGDVNGGERDCPAMKRRAQSVLVFGAEKDRPQPHRSRHALRLLLLSVLPILSAVRFARKPKLHLFMKLSGQCGVQTRWWDASLLNHPLPSSDEL